MQDFSRAGRLRIPCANGAYCAQISKIAHTARKLRNLRCALRLIFFANFAQLELRLKAYFFRVARFALRIYKAICVFAICALKK